MSPIIFGQIVFTARYHEKPYTEVWQMEKCARPGTDCTIAYWQVQSSKLPVQNVEPVICHVVSLSGVTQRAPRKERLLGIDSLGLPVLVVPEDLAGWRGSILNHRGVECERYGSVDHLLTIVTCRKPDTQLASGEPKY